MKNHDAYHLVSAEKHIERSLTNLTNDAARLLVNQAYALITQAGNILEPDDIERLRRERIDPMM